MGMYRWRGRGRFWGEPPTPLSVLELDKSGTVDLRLAALLWLIMENRASVLVAAGPSFAGKTTTLNVVMDFLPPQIRQVRLRGYGEDFSFVQTGTPSDTYIVAEEFSDYGDYIWGDTAVRAFQLLQQGYSLGGTIHARTAKEVVYILNQYLGLPASLIGHIGAVVTLRVTRGSGYDAEPTRRVDAVSLITAEQKGIAIETIASGEMGGDAFILAGEKALERSLSAKFGLDKIDVRAELAKRRQLLEELREQGKISRDEVRRAVVEFYSKGPS